MYCLEPAWCVGVYVFYKSVPCVCFCPNHHHHQQSITSSICPSSSVTNDEGWGCSGWYILVASPFFHRTWYTRLKPRFGNWDWKTAPTELKSSPALGSWERNMRKVLVVVFQERFLSLHVSEYDLCVRERGSIIIIIIIIIWISSCVDVWILACMVEPYVRVKVVCYHAWPESARMTMGIRA